MNFEAERKGLGQAYSEGGQIEKEKCMLRRSKIAFLIVFAFSVLCWGRIAEAQLLRERGERKFQGVSRRENVGQDAG